jgi:hypothetical protein
MVGMPRWHLAGGMAVHTRSMVTGDMFVGSLERHSVVFGIRRGGSYRLSFLLRRSTGFEFSWPGFAKKKNSHGL